jgi:hypothetical protein
MLFCWLFLVRCRLRPLALARFDIIVFSTPCQTEMLVYHNQELARDTGSAVVPYGNQVDSMHGRRMQPYTVEERSTLGFRCKNARIE